MEADLKDINDGVSITHELDERRRIKQEKSEKKQKNKDKRIDALERKVIAKGYENLSESDKRAVVKYIEQNRIKELKRLHEEESKKVTPTQISLFDLLEGGV